MAFDRPADIKKDASQLYAYSKGWHEKGRRRECVSGPKNVLPPGRDGQVDKLAAGAEIFTAFGLYTSLHSWKGTAVAARRGWP